MEFTRDNDQIGKIRVYFLSTKYMYLKARLDRIISICISNKEFRIEFEMYPEYNMYHTVQANEWQYLATLLQSNIPDSTQSLYLDFQFIVLKNVPEVGVDVPKSQLINDFEVLLNNGLYSDVTMKSAEGIEYKVHKNVLASRSAVLKASFEHNTTECSTNIVESHLESDILREVLTFIYSDKAPRVDEMAEKLLAAADYYQLNRLKSLCERALHKKLTVENAIETLQLADLYSANTLKQLTVEFINDGRAKRIFNFKTESRAQLKSVELIKIIHEYSHLG